MKKNMEDLLDEFQYREILDRTHLISNIIDTHLIQHPVFKLDKNISKKIGMAADILADAYQEIGITIHKKFD